MINFSLNTCWRLIPTEEETVADEVAVFFVLCDVVFWAKCHLHFPSTFALPYWRYHPLTKQPHRLRAMDSLEYRRGVIMKHHFAWLIP